MINQINNAQGVYYLTWAGVDQIFLTWYDFTYTQLDSTLLYNTIEIRVYP
jgi:hypothetical protein